MKAQKKDKKKPDKILDKTKVRRFTCLVCPTCCELETDGIEVIGAGCPRGEAFGLQEMVMPLRVVTTSVGCQTAKGVAMIPVKTASPVPIARIFEILKEIKALHLSGVPAIGTRLTTGSPQEPVEWIVTGEVV